MTIKVSKEAVDAIGVETETYIELSGTCDICGRAVHGLLGLLEADELKRNETPSMMLFHIDGDAFDALRDCPNPEARLIID